MRISIEVLLSLEKLQIGVARIHFPDRSECHVGTYAIAERFLIKQLTYQSRISPAYFPTRADKRRCPGAAHKGLPERFITR